MLHQRFRGYLPVVIDVETAGFNAKTDALLELAAVTVRMDEHGQLQPAQAFHYHIEPFAGANLEPSALAFNGIDPSNPLRGAISEKEALNALFKAIREEMKLQQCTRAMVVAHNAAFDHGFLNAATERTNNKRSPFHPFVHLDTTSLAALSYGHTVLAKSCELAGIAFDNKQAHSALYDTERTAELFCTMINRYQQLGGWPPPSESAATAD